ncbi:MULTISPECIES: xanthine dehydrogenase family protein molybdopterin-binding subunit [unclassified Streptomyces]|uniref:xanthine dehydrogenase family protein molybdopterin-binding subunit n=1 Tax=unclassified Streptomyces TaxID=2593676 RepID=UPI00224D1A55|nr:MULTISPECIES: xanthine dehydrogenase family protein molybdopterin-binding subunit [unclassified Streptomyces]WSP53386.1 xanthine dehydrogenase family protein molybdopterin-binding subunit [Streptomyces sp. NBC_01241]WSU25942.1 xanthine dehydrogenase family protein molybdopterin-binding subunit [Streptomyces sp. NBC_01108]MCX4784756.1 xanthine dehydrogenase family protein molybdopterin-binding subunit [Streptomyces sp. NBC_01221]MCX4799286.1 xanthine dehydrogenase family protein molybdopterin
MSQAPPPLGTPVLRREGRDKVTGTARYAAEHTPPGCLYGRPVPATIARGRVSAIHTDEALALPGVRAVLTHENAPRLKQPDDPILAVLQDDRVPHRGWHIALVVADTLEQARAGAEALRISYEPAGHDVLLTEDHPGLYTPKIVNGDYPAVRERGDADRAFATAPVQVDVTYTLGALHNHPMEPHASTAQWTDDGRLTVHDAGQGSTTVRDSLAIAFGLRPQQVTVVSEHVGGGFGSKGTPRPQAVLAAMAARHTGHPVKIALPRRQMAAVVGHRAPTVQHVRLGAELDGTLTSVTHEVVTQTSTIKEFVEQAAVPTRVMYGSAHSRTAHRVTALDVPSPSWMRAPGETPGLYALESAMDELATALGMDPVELRLRNDPVTEPDSGRPFSSRGLAACLEKGAARFGWYERDARPAVREEGPLLLGTGVAAATYPVYILASSASAHAAPDGSYLIRVNATDIGTGARTVLAQIAASVLETPVENVRIDIGNSELPDAPLAGGSSGTASWGWSVHKASTDLLRQLRERTGPLPAGGLTAFADTEQETSAKSPYARHAFGAHFAEVAVDSRTGEVRVRRMLGVFAAGRILNPRTARSQFTGGMTMGIGMALTESSTMDPAFGDFTESDLASYHVPVCADVPDIEVDWIDEIDPHLNPMGSKGIGEIGIVGAAAAVGNAVRHATGVRLRSLPITPDTLLPYLL